MLLAYICTVKLSSSSMHPIHWSPVTATALDNVCWWHRVRRTTRKLYMSLHTFACSRLQKPVLVLFIEGSWLQTWFKWESYVRRWSSMVIGAFMIYHMMCTEQCYWFSAKGTRAYFRFKAPASLMKRSHRSFPVLRNEVRLRKQQSQ